MHRRSALATLAISAMLLTGCGSIAKTTVTETVAVAAQVQVPSVTGLSGDVARDAIEAAGLEVDWSELVIKPSNWTVTDQSPAAGAELPTGATVKLTVTKPDNTEAKTDDPPAAAAPQAPAQPDVPTEYRSALKKAQSYSSVMHMSKAGLYEQLVSEYGEKFSPEAAQYAVDNVQADWNANALAKAKSYQDSMSMSPAAIYDQLVSEYGEQFAPEEADYAVQNLGG